MTDVEADEDEFFDNEDLARRMEAVLMQEDPIEGARMLGTEIRDEGMGQRDNYDLS